MCSKIIFKYQFNSFIEQRMNDHRPIRKVSTQRGIAKDEIWDQNSAINQQNSSLKNKILSNKWSVLIAIAIVVIGALIWRSVMKIEKERNDLSEQAQRRRWVQRFESTLHRNSDLTFGYPTVGIPIAGNTYNYALVKIHELAYYDKTVNALFQPYNDTDCELALIGDPNDGGYVLCKNVLAKSEAVISLGANGAQHKGFGCELAAASKTPNYLYDCTNGQLPVCPDGSLITFKQICVGDRKGKVNGFMVHKLEEIIKDRRLTKKHITLKIDAEGGEYPAFKAFPAEDLDFIDQIILDINFGPIYPEYWGNLDVFRSLMEKFVSVSYHLDSKGCLPYQIRALRNIKSMAYKVTLVNKKLIKIYSNSRSDAFISPNTPTTKLVPDCQANLDYNIAN